MVCSVEIELIKIGSKPWIKAQEAFTEVTKIVEELTLLKVYYDGIRLSQVT